MMAVLSDPGVGREKIGRRECGYALSDKPNTKPTALCCRVFITEGKSGARGHYLKCRSADMFSLFFVFDYFNDVLLPAAIID